jgi:hypothetical protein
MMIRTGKALRILFEPLTRSIKLEQSLLNNKKISHMEGFDSLVKDMSLAEWGRKEIELAQVEMPGTDHSWRLIIIFYRFDGLPY